MNIRSGETEIVGEVVLEGGERIKGPGWKRIEWLVENLLEKLAHHPKEGMWRTLFRDPRDGRYWEQTFPESEYHGGGPPRLSVVTEQDAREEYRLN